MRACAICDTSVYIPKQRLGLAHYFCSSAHANEWQGRAKVAYECKVCGETFRKSASFEKFGRILYCSQECRNADPEFQARLRQMTADQQRQSPNKLEIAGYAMLDRIGVAYVPQAVIADKFCVDAFVPDRGMVVQFDGDYWHGNPDKFPCPDPRQRRRIALDASQDAYLQTCGYRVFRVWERDLSGDAGMVEARLLAFLSDNL